MSVLFIDFEAYQDDDANYLIKELCIMDVDNILKPFYYMFTFSESMESFSKSAQKTNNYLLHRRHHLLWPDGDCKFDPALILQDLPSNALYYVKDQINGKKINTLKHFFPNLRIVNYNSKNLLHIPNNIKCPYYNHGDFCAYKKCLRLCVHYLSCK